MTSKQAQADKAGEASEAQAPKSASPPTSAEVSPKPEPAKPIEAPLVIPPLLLEGDEPTTPHPSGEIEKFSLGPSLRSPAPEAQPELPEAYGTKQVLLAARDPHWLYAHWDLTREQQLAYNAQALHHHLIVRVHSEQPTTEIHVHPESRHWFIEVPRANAQYRAEVGFYPREGQWESIATSSPATTPPDRMSEQKGAWFATGQAGRFAAAEPQPPIPPATETTEQPGQLTLLPSEPARPPRIHWIPALESNSFDAEPGALPFPQHAGGPGTQTLPTQLAPAWSATQEQALAELIGVPSLPYAAPSSLEMVLPQWPTSLGPPAPAPQKSFWLDVNTDLIVFGATDPCAKVSLGGQPVELRPDGTFSCRVALPEGQHELELQAVSSENELRAVQLTVSRRTNYAAPSPA